MKIKLMQIVLIICNSACALAIDKRECTKADALEAERLAANLKSWPEVHGAFTRFRHCDDGAIGEGFSESVSQLLANRWETLSELQRFSKHDKAFENFVLKHIDETILDVNVRKIRNNASSGCPKDLGEFCKKVVRATKK